jgi:hypothetical protein
MTQPPNRQSGLLSVRQPVASRVFQGILTATHDDQGIAIIGDEYMEHPQVVHDEGFSVQLRSHDPSRAHTTMRELLFRKIRITIEVID